MENILLAIDATDFDTSAIDFACYLGRLTNSKITGVFLENLVANERAVFKKISGRSFLEWEIDEDSPVVIEKRQTIKASINQFRQACELRSVRCAILRNEGVPSSEMLAESRYADLIITDAATSFKKVFEGSPTHFVKDLLKHAECPVIIAPESFDGVNEIIFTYDGSRSCVFAMKQFTYLFPELEDKKITVFHVNEDGDLTEQEKHKLTGWLQQHYSSIGFESVKGDPGDELLSQLFLRKNVFIVMGAYGRSSISRFFKRSHADLLLKTLSQPVFIVHL